jgi:alpha-1,2-mannosyltransferase
MNLRHKVCLGLVLVYIFGTVWLFAREFPDAPNVSSARMILIAWIAVWSLIYFSTWLGDIRRSPITWWRHAVVLLVFIASVTVGLTMWLDLTLGGSLINNDFTQDYLAGYALRRSANIYGAPLSSLSMELFDFEAKNFHPPFDALLFMPLSYLPYRAAFALWSLLSLLSFGALVVYSLNACGLARYPWLPLSALLLLWKPFTASIWLGQVSIVLAFLIVLGFAALERGRDKAAGFLFAGATLIKLFPGFLLLYFVVQRRWRCAVTWAATVAAGLLISLAVTGRDNSLYYIERVLPEQMRLFGSFPFNISIEGVVRTIFGPNEYFTPALALHPDAVKALVLVFSLIFIIAAWSAAWSRGSENADKNVFVLFCVTMLLVSPLTWPHTCLMLILALAMLLRDGIVHQQMSSLRVLIVVSALFSVPDPVVLNALNGIYGEDVPWYILVIVKAGFFALLILWVTFWLRVRRRRKVSVAAVEAAGSCGIRAAGCS